jgi:hypothetical protein
METTKTTKNNTMTTKTRRHEYNTNNNEDKTEPAKTTISTRRRHMINVQRNPPGASATRHKDTQCNNNGVPFHREARLELLWRRTERESSALDFFLYFEQNKTHFYKHKKKGYERIFATNLFLISEPYPHPTHPIPPPTHTRARSTPFIVLVIRSRVLHTKIRCVHFFSVSDIFSLP